MAPHSLMPTAVGVVLFLFSPSAFGQEPHIISEEVQKLALEIGVAEKLGIDWSEASAADIKRYIDFLTAADVVAEARASFAKESPTEEDYKAGWYPDCFGHQTKNQNRG